MKASKICPMITFTWNYAFSVLVVNVKMYSSWLNINEDLFDFAKKFQYSYP